MARSNTKIRESSKEILSNSFFLCCNLNHSNMPIWNDPLYLPWMCDLYEWLKAKFCVVPVPLVKLLQKSLEKTPKRGGDSVWCWAEIRKWSTSCEKAFCCSLDQPGLAAINADVLSFVKGPTVKIQSKMKSAWSHPQAHVAMESHVLPGHTYRIPMVANGPLVNFLACNAGFQTLSFNFAWPFHTDIFPPNHESLHS